MLSSDIPLHLPSSQAEDYRWLKGKKRQTLIFIPPLGFNWTYWKRSIDYFHRKGYSVLAITPKGHSPLRTRYRTISLDDHVRNVQKLCAELGINIKKSIPIGASFGGLIAVPLCTGEKLKKCICINTPFEGVKHLKPSLKLIGTFLGPFAHLDLFNRTKKIVDFSKSRTSHTVLMMLLALKYFNAKGIYLNYLCLKRTNVTPTKGCVVICSSDDEVLSLYPSPDYFIAGNHNCALSQTVLFNKVLEHALEH